MKLLLYTVAALFLTQAAHCASVVPAGDLYVATGSSAVLTCSVEHGQDVRWLKGDLASPVSVADLNDSSLTSGLNTLTISNFSNTAHGGPYSCLVQGPLGHRQLTCPTQIHHARIMANSTSQHVTKPVQVVENGTAVFVCDVPPSWPPAHFHWEKEGQRIDHEAESRLWLMPSGNLYIVGVTAQDDGHYTCSAVNPVTMATRHSHTSYQLTVEAYPVNTTSAPAFTVTPVNTLAYVGTRALIECIGHAHPTPTLEWIIIHDVRFPREGSVLPTGTLQFDAVVPEDAGTYRCRLSNSVGADYVDVTLEVREHPTFKSIPAPLLELPQDRAMAMNNTLLTCTATGSIPLDLLLVHDGQVLMSETVTDTSGGIVLTHSVIDEGYYQCFARNDVGCEQWTTFALRATEAPSTTPPLTGATTVTEAPSTTPPLTGATTVTEAPSTTPPLTGATTVTEAPSTTPPLTGATTVTEAPSTTPPLTGATTVTEAASTTPPLTGATTVTEAASTTPPLTGATTVTEAASTTPPLTGATTVTEAASTTPPLTGATTVTEAASTTPPLTGATTVTEVPSTTPPLTTVTEAPSTTLPPSLEIMTSGDLFAVDLGDALSFECQVFGGGEGTTLTWYFNNELISGPKVEEAEHVDGRSLLVSQLSFDQVKEFHAGEYMCVAHSPLLNQNISAPVTLLISFTLHPPLSLSVAVSEGGLLVSWLPNPFNPQDILGYKLTWDIPSRVVQSALMSVAPSVKQYLIEGWSPLMEYVIQVWAYTIDGDGPPATTRWTPKSTMTTTETVAMTTTVTTTPSPVCVAMETGPSEVLLEWTTEEVGGANITASCQQSRTSSVVSATMATNSYKITELLPGCHYEFNVGVASCSVDTPPGPVDLGEKVHRYDNGSIQLEWRLPRGLEKERELVIHVRINNGDWLTVSYHDSTPHIPTHLEEGGVQKLEFRFRLFEWEGFATVMVPLSEPSSPPAPTASTTTTEEEEGGASGLQLLSEVGLIYGVVFGLLVVACAVVVAVILGLKYVQMTRRDTDKVATHREVQREEFRRLSLARSSVKSQKDPTDFYQPTQTDV